MRGAAGIGTASVFADVGQEIPTSLLPALPTSTLGAPASALGVIEGVPRRLVGPALGDVRHVVASPARAREALGFTAAVTPADGLRAFATAALRAPANP